MAVAMVAPKRQAGQAAFAGKLLGGGTGPAALTPPATAARTIAPRGARGAEPPGRQGEQGAPARRRSRRLRTRQHRLAPEAVGLARLPAAWTRDDRHAPRRVDSHSESPSARLGAGGRQERSRHIGDPDVVGDRAKCRDGEGSRRGGLGGWRGGSAAGVRARCAAARWRWKSGDSSIVDRAIQTQAARAEPTSEPGCASPRFPVGGAHRGTVNAVLATASSAADLARGRCQAR